MASILMLWIIGLVGFGAFPASSAIEVKTILENLLPEVECNQCNRTIQVINNFITNNTKVDYLINSVDDICINGLLDKYPYTQKRCKKNIDIIVRSIVSTLLFNKKNPKICKEVLQCNSKFKYEIAVKKASELGFILISKIGSMSEELSNTLFQLITSREEGARKVVEEICEDTSFTNDTSSYIHKKLQNVCNFNDGNAQCSLCELVTEFLASFLDKEQERIEKMFNNFCTMLLPPVQCSYVGRNIIEKVYKVLHVAVHYHVLCNKLSYCPHNPVTEYCRKIDGIGHVLCELVVLDKYSYKLSELDKLTEEGYITQQMANVYCKNCFHNVSTHLENHKQNLKSLLNGMCLKLPNEYSRVCQYLIKIKFESFFMKIVKLGKNENTCCSIGICGNAKQSSRDQNNQIACGACEVAAKLVESSLSSPNTRHTIKTLMNKWIQPLRESGFSDSIEKAIHLGLNYIRNNQNLQKSCGASSFCK